MATIGENIKKYRNKLDLSQAFYCFLGLWMTVMGSLLMVKRKKEDITLLKTYAYTVLCEKE